MLILASASPRRHELLAAAGIDHVVRPVHVDETCRSGETPQSYVARVSLAKAQAAELPKGSIVLAADTTVSIDEHILGKPLHDADARRMLSLLSGRRHKVLTGIALRHAAGIASAVSETEVRFAPLSPSAIEDYLATGEPLDKAGAYGIQGYASRFVERIDGCYHNVVGLPVSLVWQHLQRLAAPS